MKGKSAEGMPPVTTVLDEMVQIIMRLELVRGILLDKTVMLTSRLQFSKEAIQLEGHLEQLCQLAGVVYHKQLSVRELAGLQRRAVEELHAQAVFTSPARGAGSATVPLAPPPSVVPLAEESVEDIDIDRLHVDFIYFCRHALRIPYRPGMSSHCPEGGFGPFVLTSAQEKFVALMIDHLLVKRLPLRLILLKSRQLGCTTLLLAFWVWLMLTHDHFHVMLIIDKDKHNLTKREMVVSWLEYIGSKFECFPSIRKREEKILFFSNGSKFFFESAESPNPGTSEMIHVLHESEKPKWPNGRAAQVEESVTPGLPTGPMTIHVDESTAQGIDDFFIKWDRTVRGKGSGGGLQVLPIFLPWMVSREYTIPAPDDFTFLNDDDELGDTIYAEDTGEETLLTEQTYAELYGLTIDQVYWRRQKIKDTFKGVRQSFDQEYPTTPSHAWRHVRSGFFSTTLLRTIGAKYLKKPVFVGNIEDLRGYTDVHTVCLVSLLKPRLVSDPHGALWIYEHPQLHLEYFLGMDVSEGKMATNEHGEQEPDSTVFHVEDQDGFTVAVWKTTLKPEEAWLPLCLLGLYFNAAWINGERNGPGLVVLKNFVRTGYPRPLVNAKPEGRSYEDRMWTTIGPGNRETLLIQLRAEIAKNPARVCDATLLDEMHTFVRRTTGRLVRYEAAPGKHDDVLFGRLHSTIARIWRFGAQQVEQGQVPAPDPVQAINRIIEANDQFKLTDTDLFGEGNFRW